MGKRKGKKSKAPRHKRLKRPQRLQAAVHWIPKYEGKNLVRGYGKHFGVDKLCAVTKLEMLGYSYSKLYKQKLRDDEVRKQQAVERRKANKKKKQIEDTFLMNTVMERSPILQAIRPVVFHSVQHGKI